MEFTETFPIVPLFRIMMPPRSQFSSRIRKTPFFLRVPLAFLLLSGPLQAEDAIPREPAEQALPPAPPTQVESELMDRSKVASVLLNETLQASLIRQTLGPDGQEKPREKLSLQHVIDQALQANLGLVVTRYDPLIARDNLTIAEAEFDPQLSSSFRATERLSPLAATNLETAIGNTKPFNTSQTFQLGAQQKVSTGATIGIGTAVSRATSNSTRNLINPDVTSEISLNIRQPLLRGAGREVNLAQIAKNRLALTQSHLQVRREILDVIADAEISYWDLATAMARKQLQLSNLALANKLLEENRERERLGLATRLEVLQAEANVAAQTEQIILAEENIENAQDTLRVILGIIPTGSEPYIEVDPLPEFTPELPDFQEALRSALAQDMDIQIQYEIIEQRKLDRMVAKDNTLPSLDLVAGVGVLGRSDRIRPSYRGAAEADGHFWSAGLELSFPWGMRADNARYRTSERQVQRETTRLASIQQILLQRLRSAWRAVAAGRERTSTTRASLMLNEESFARQLARYQAGASSFRDVLEAQRDLDQARLRHLEATADLVRAVVQLARLDGTLLRRHNFTWEEVDELTSPPPPSITPLPVTDINAPGTPTVQVSP